MAVGVGTGACFSFHFLNSSTNEDAAPERVGNPGAAGAGVCGGEVAPCRFSQSLNASTNGSGTRAHLSPYSHLVLGTNPLYPAFLPS